ncbi:DUF3833 family protein [Sulfitobacter sabulilitoris]|uniref:DUF3833 domain-containing protein n=1 Tax=Sulfitobacter sabulilitoris TaxID=2562655 RepID=A0A5S3PE86_9RHOB|nr:DUF3833 family protein [Sulfitobacter sabulilitoris]TMM52328.1 DUF3833 domain-containing protein [Sulfitobacter sabulilitoris]
MLMLVWARSRFWGFRSQRPDEYLDGDPHFDVRERLNGITLCEGVIYGPLGRVSSRFVAEFEGEWTGNRGVIKERFRYDDGSTQDREWHLDVDDTGAISATAPDVVGEGKGRQSGATVQLKYRIRLPENSGGHVLDTVDWMYMTPSGTIMNRSQFRKFGIQVAELVATIRPKEAS